jgi:acyl-CoA hydrolase
MPDSAIALDGAIDMWYADGPGAPRLPPERVLELAGFAPDTPCRVSLGWMVERCDWFEKRRPGMHVRTVMAGYGLSSAIAQGTVDALPLRLSAVPSMIREQTPDIAVVGAVRSGDVLRFGCSVGWADVLAASARRVIVEVDEAAPDVGAPEIIGNVVAAEVRWGGSGAAVRSRSADAVDLKIGSLVASLLPADPTVQVGPGAIGEAILKSITTPVRIWSGLATDEVAGLSARGLLREPAVAAYAWGREPIVELARTGMLRLTSTTETHDFVRLAEIPRFVACNTAIQIGLDGSVNVERSGNRTIAGVGGHADFCLGASRSTGGVSLIAARSTGPDGASTIRPYIDAVSTPRSDVDVVVTEHGVADLRGVGISERSRRLIGVADPAHRNELYDALRRTR